jgi:hypothetical protein
MPKRKTGKLTEINTVSQAAAARFVGVSREAIRKAIAQGRLRSVVVEGPGAAPRVLLRDLEAWKRTRAE